MARGLYLYLSVCVLLLLFLIFLIFFMFFSLFFSIYGPNFELYLRHRNRKLALRDLNVKSVFA